MPSHPKPRAMSADEFRGIVGGVGLAVTHVAGRLGVSRQTVYGWMSGRVPISAEKAALIRERLEPR